MKNNVHFILFGSVLFTALKAFCELLNSANPMGFTISFSHKNSCLISKIFMSENE